MDTIQVEKVIYVLSKYLFKLNHAQIITFLHLHKTNTPCLLCYWHAFKPALKSCRYLQRLQELKQGNIHVLLMLGVAFLAKKYIHIILLWSLQLLMVCYQFYLLQHSLWVSESQLSLRYS